VVRLVPSGGEPPRIVDHRHFDWISVSVAVAAFAVAFVLNVIVLAWFVLPVLAAYTLCDLSTFAKPRTHRAASPKRTAVTNVGLDVYLDEPWEGASTPSRGALSPTGAADRPSLCWADYSRCCHCCYRQGLARGPSMR
jgi:hypothetical protein